MSNLFNVSSIPLHINQYNYQMNTNDTYLVVETYSNINLPNTPNESKAVMLINASSHTIIVNSNNNANKIYNNLYAPEGTFSLNIDPYRIVYFIYTRNLTTQTGFWLTHLG
jgi:hypothetical protein